jgi:hypothetical protein
VHEVAKVDVVVHRFRLSFVLGQNPEYSGQPSRSAVDRRRLMSP